MQQPWNLARMISMHQPSLPNRPIHLRDTQGQTFARPQVVGTKNIQRVLNLDVIIGRWLRERKRQHPLLLQIRLVDARETASYHRHPTEKSWF